jgi:hypothetical protein
MLHKPSPPVRTQLDLGRQALLNKSEATSVPLLHIGVACALAIAHRGIGVATISFSPSIATALAVKPYTGGIP